MTKVAAIQFNPEIGKPARNLQQILNYLEKAAKAGVELAVFPEAALSGYVYDQKKEAFSSAETIPGPSILKFEEKCRQLKICAVTGLLERDGNRLFNAAVLCGPDGLIGHYRKTHLPFLGVDRFATPGDFPLHVSETPAGRIGVMICYDQRFPEVARCLALQGADIIALPTNWPVGADSAPEFILRTRALENRVFLIGANRVGVERGARFIGRSCILDPAGKRLAEADAESEVMLLADINPAEARQKRLVIEKGKFEMDTVGDRRPELYGVLTKPREQEQVESLKVESLKVKSRTSRTSNVGTSNVRTSNNIKSNA